MRIELKEPDVRVLLSALEVFIKAVGSKATTNPSEQRNIVATVKRVKANINFQWTEHLCPTKISLIEKSKENYDASKPED